MGGDHAFRIDHQIAFGHRQIAVLAQDPQGRAAEAGIARRLAFQPGVGGGIARVDRQQPVGAHRAPAEQGPAQPDAIFAGLAFKAVADADLRHHEAEAFGKLPPQPGQPRHQRRALALVRQMDQAIAQLDRDQRGFADIGNGEAGRIGRGFGRGDGGDGARGGALAQAVPHEPGESGKGQEDHLRHGGNRAQQRQDRRHRGPGAVIGQLPADLARQVAAVRHAGDDHRGGNRQQQRRDRGDQRIAHRQCHIQFARLASRKPVADHAQHQPADHIDRQDQQRGDRIALHELAGAIHRTVEIRLGGDFAAAGLGFIGGDEACGEIRVDRHLLAGQGIEGEARGHFGNAPRALGDDHQVDDHQDQEHEQPDREIAADQEGGKRLDHMACRRRAFVPVDQHHARGSDVEREAQQRGEQQHGREGTEIERLVDVHRGHQHREAERDVEHEEHIQQQRRDRQHQQEDHHQDRARQSERGGEHGLHRAHIPNRAMVR